MKARNVTRGIRVKTWLYFALFSVLILLLLVAFQQVFFEPYYRSTKIHDIRYIVEDLAKNINDIDVLNRITVNNDGCSVIISTDGSTHVDDAIGVSCLIYRDKKVSTEYLDQLKENEKGELALIAQFSDNSQEMLIFGKTFYENDLPFYVLFNTPLHPVSSTIAIIREQYIYIVIVVLLLSLIISLYFSRNISKPILSMKKEAEKLSKGNYEDVHFDDNSSYAELNELSDTLNSTSRELAKINELRSDLFANVSHDVRTPLTMIQAYAEMIRDIYADDPEKREESIEVILEEVEYMSKLTDDMSEMTKMQSGQTKLNITDFDLCGVIDSVADKFSMITREEGVTIVRDVEPELLAHADKFRITEVIYNFVGNALKFYGKDKQIIIRAYRTGNGMIRVEVTDHGPGIDDEQLAHIWERYYKTDKKYQRAHRGSGLGLAICKAILDQHNAVYGVETKLKEGSTFYFEIPATKIT
ncbi:MAG: HAMP domain-containing histidine kinase [Erysipelotrichales bacterium]|nr:HAMP domain-containing histidine kinase [Erysipelotrichales bacterium]